jgi:hypothetical protein
LKQRGANRHSTLQYFFREFAGLLKVVENVIVERSVGFSSNRVFRLPVVERDVTSLTYVPENPAERKLRTAFHYNKVINHLQLLQLSE